MERFSDENLTATLRALRATPRPEFAADLDVRAAAGFPRRSSGGSTAIESSVERLVARVRALRPRQILLPAGAIALAAVLAATVVVAVAQRGSSGEATIVQRSVRDEVSANAFRADLSEELKSPPGYLKNAFKATDGEGGYGYGKSAGARASNFESSAAAELEEAPAASATDSPTPGPFASDTAHRDVERSAEMVLGAAPGEVAERAREVFEAVHANDGIVLRSSIRDGAAGDAGARFELLIPSAKLSDALADFSEIGEVRSRHEATADITAPTVSAGEHLRDSRARIDGLLAQLAEADTESEREAVEAELRFERARAAALQTRLAKLDRRANLSRVQVRIETGDSATSSQDDSSWGIGDATGDAGRILGIAAGVTLVGLAVLAPIALIGLLAWLAQRAWVRRGRERALS